MRNPRRRSMLIIPVLAALALGAAVLGQTPATATTAVAADDVPDKAYDAAEAGPSTCNGGAQKAALIRQNDQPTTLAENGAAFTPLVWAAVPFNVPAGETDQVVVTFSGEARLAGQTFTAIPADFVQVRILLDGVPMSPLNDLMFTTGIGAANAAEACKRVPHDDNGHIVRVEWRLVDQTGAVLTGTLDDAVLHVEINE